jgi:hypothetical protein
MVIHNLQPDLMVMTVRMGPLHLAISGAIQSLLMGLYNIYKMILYGELLMRRAQPEKNDFDLITYTVHYYQDTDNIEAL